MKLIKSMDLKEREDLNPDNTFNIGEKDEKNEILDNLINEEQEVLDWSKVSPLIRYEGKPPPIIMDNIDKIIDINTIGVKTRNLPSQTDLSVLTSQFDPSSRKWLEAKRASHPFISAQMTKIDPRKSNREDSETTTQCLMADSGVMCSLLNFKTVKSMGINPENMEISNVLITGVNGKKLQSVTRQMHVRIVNSRNKA